MELVERTNELLILAETFKEAAQGRGATVVVSGEPGIGKTALVREFTESLGNRVRVLWGVCDDLTSPRPLGPFRDIARHGEMPATADRDELLEALADVLSFKQRPAVLVIEDVHWIDDASVDIIRYLVRRLATLPAMLIMTRRSEEMAPEHPLRRAMAGLTHSELRRIELPASPTNRCGP